MCGAGGGPTGLPELLCGAPARAALAVWLTLVRGIEPGAAGHELVPHVALSWPRGKGPPRSAGPVCYAVPTPGQCGTRRHEVHTEAGTCGAGLEVVLHTRNGFCSLVLVTSTARLRWRSGVWSLPSWSFGPTVSLPVKEQVLRGLFY